MTADDGMLTLDEALGELRRLSPAYSLEVGQWRPAASLDASAVSGLIHAHARARGMVAGRQAASLLFQRYCHRMAPLALGTWVLTGQVLDLSRDQVTICFRDGSPVGAQHSGVRRAASGAELVRGLIDEHLEILAGLVCAEGGTSLPNLWGNMAASIGMAARALSGIRPAELVRQRAEEVLGCRPQLLRMGSFRVLVGPCGPRLFYDRKSCCHWYAAPDGQYCSYCSLISPTERTRRFIASMAECT